MKLFLVGRTPPEDNKHMNSQSQSNPNFYSPRTIWAEHESDAVGIARERYDGTFYAMELPVFETHVEVVKRA